MLQLDASMLKARNTLLMMFLLLLVLDVTLVLMAQDRWAIGRILLTMIVMYFVMQGRKWAKWLLVGICSLLVIALVAMVMALSSKLSMMLIVGSIMMAILSATIATYLFKSEALNRYFSYKRRVNF